MPRDLYTRSDPCAHFVSEKFRKMVFAPNVHRPQALAASASWPPSISETLHHRFDISGALRFGGFMKDR